VTAGSAGADGRLLRLVGIRAGVHLVDGDEVLARHPWGVTGLGRPHPATLAALRTLQQRVVRADRIGQLVLDLPDGTRAAADELVSTLERIPFLLTRHLAWEGRIELSVTPIARDSDFRPSRPGHGSRLRLSRFAYCRRAVRELVLESPLSLERSVLRSPALGMLVQALCRPVSAEDLPSALGDPRAPLVEAAVEYLLGTSAVVCSGADEPFLEDVDEARRQWSFHDLLFHSRSRRGRHDYPSGATYRFAPGIGPLPAVAALVPARPGAGAAVELHRPDWDALVAADASLTEVLEARGSVRQYAAEPISAEQLGEFLYRTARVRTRYGATAEVPYERTSRPYPSGGAEYELELYPVVARCRGLEPGAYHYDALDHRLWPLPSPEEDVARVRQDTSRAMGGRAEPDVLIVLASRFQRVAWKYDSIAYSLTLKHVGVLYQTMYLVATAMGLGGCAIGVGDSDVSGRMLGLDYLREGSVGEFALGRPAAEGDGSPGLPADEVTADNDLQWREWARQRLASRPRSVDRAQ
jgi:SagB-type dehydrogenase family enzyme